MGGMIVVLMGVSGCGKTTIGRILARETRWPFLDADDFHPRANVAKMRTGTALTDDDRWPWLDRLAAEMAAINARGGHAVLACSALKEAYRDRLARGGEIRYVYLKGDRATLASRLAARAGHYMPVSLLDSQLATLEEPANAIVIDIRAPIAAQVTAIRNELNGAALPK
jgi:carbohydrate kinase (thermoresistant glucokinase family)